MCAGHFDQSRIVTREEMHSTEVIRLILMDHHDKRGTIVNHELLVAVGGTALVIAGLSGCSSGGKSAPASSSSASSGSSSATKVSIDGKDQNVAGTVVCATVAGNTNIAIGQGTTGIAAVLGGGDPPTVTSVGLGNVNGVALGFTQGAPGGEAKAEKDGKSYKITGTATGVDMANPTSPTTKPFEIDVTCP